jgi:hypothetical protein
MVAGRIHYLTTVVVVDDFRLACVRSVCDIRHPVAPRLESSLFRITDTWPAGLLLLVGVGLWTKKNLTQYDEGATDVVRTSISNARPLDY